MRTKKQIDRILYLKLLNDLIITKLSPNESIIKLVDVGNFVIIKGKTKSKDILDLHLLTSEFKEKYGHNFDDMNLNTIDIVEYECDFSDIPGMTLTSFKI